MKKDQESVFRALFKRKVKSSKKRGLIPWVSSSKRARVGTGKREGRELLSRSKSRSLKFKERLMSVSKSIRFKFKMERRR